MAIECCMKSALKLLTGVFAMVISKSEAGCPLHPYTVYYRYKAPSDKAPGIGAVKRFRLYDTSPCDARETVKRQANYPPTSP